MSRLEMIGTGIAAAVILTSPFWITWGFVALRAIREAQP